MQAQSEELQIQFPDKKPENNIELRRGKSMAIPELKIDKFYSSQKSINHFPNNPNLNNNNDIDLIVEETASKSKRPEI